MILYDVNFAGPDTRTGVQYGESTKSGAESDQELVEAVKRAGNVIMLADATYEITSEQATNQLTLPSDGYRLDAKEIIERKVIFAPTRSSPKPPTGSGITCSCSIQMDLCAI